MWVNKELFQAIIEDNKKQADLLTKWQTNCAEIQGKLDALSSQKAKDDITIDWMRHRINALEKVNSQLMAKVAGVLLPVPEIVPTRPGTVTVPSFDYMPSFEDIGDEAAKHYGVVHSDDGTLEFVK